MEMERGKLEKKGEGATDANDVVQNTRTCRSSVSVDAESSKSVDSAHDPSEEIQLLKSPANKRFTHFTAEEEDEYFESHLGAEDEDDDEGDDVDGQIKQKQKPKILRKPFALIEFLAFLCIMVLLICSSTFKQLKNHLIWDFLLWKWCVLVLAIFSGRLVAKWFMNFLLFLMYRLMGSRHIYYVRSLRKIACILIWLVFVLLIRILLFQPKEDSMFINYITRALAASLVGAALWLLKSFSVKLLALSFQSKRFFIPIQKAIFHQYLLQSLSGPPILEIIYVNEQNKSETAGVIDTKEENHVIDVEKLGRIKRQKVSAWTMKRLIDVASSKLSILSNQLDEEEEEEYEDKVIKSELEAEHAANKIFANVAKPGCKCIYKEDLLRFVTADEVSLLLNVFPGATKNGKIPKSKFKKWVVKVYNERKALSHFIKQSKSATQELNRLFSGIVIVVIIVLWLILMGFLSTQALVFIISQLVLAAFMFGNTAKNTFESVMFLYVMHPFDVGDRCIIDGVQMVVDEIHILTTTFVRYDNEKLFYPNSVLATKPITNYYRSTGKMRDSVDFSIDASTSVQTVEALNSRIQDYLNSNPEHWRPHNSKLVVKEIEDADKIRMVLHVTHTINFQDYGEKSSRRSKLLLRLKQIFQDLGISKYHVLPEPQISSAAPPVPQP